VLAGILRSIWALRSGRRGDCSYLYLEPIQLHTREENMGNESKREKPAHGAGARKGEEVRADEGKESGRHDRSDTGANRPAGGRTARDSTRINPDKEEPIDPNSPEMPPA
jgi:hypothetical protein